MNNSIFKSTRAAMLILAVFSLIFITGCQEDDPVDPPILVEDGNYVSGDATFLDGISTDGAFAPAINEVGQVERATLFEAWLPLKASGGFNFSTVEGTTTTTWGPSSDFATVSEAGANDQVNTDYQKGGIEATDVQFTVPADGFYHIAFDTEVGKAVIVPVTGWGIIGGATASGWSSDQDLVASALDANEMTWSATDVPLTLGDFKFRYSDGWKVELDTPDIKLNANFGGAVDALVPGGNNIPITSLGYTPSSGLYDITMTWTSGEGYSATMVRTGNLAAFDYSSTEFALIGDGVGTSAGQADWDTPILLQAPVVNGSVYTWSWSSIQSYSAGGFKIREGLDWAGLSAGYNDVTLTGDGAADFTYNADGNFIPLVDGALYNFTYTIDAISDVRTFDADVQ